MTHDTNTTPTEVRLASFEGRLKHFESVLVDFGGKFDALFSKLDHIENRERVSWPLIVALVSTIFVCAGSVGGALIYVGQLALNPIRYETQRIDARISSLEQAERSISVTRYNRQDHKNFLESEIGPIKDTQLAQERRIVRLETILSLVSKAPSAEGSPKSWQ